MNRESKIRKALELISDGQSVRKACAAAGIAFSTFRDNVDPAQYAHAREAQADTYFDEMAELEARCRDGELVPQVFRVMLDSLKWRLARMRPNVYGNKLTVVEQRPPAVTVRYVDANEREYGRAEDVPG